MMRVLITAVVLGGVVVPVQSGCVISVHKEISEKERREWFDAVRAGSEVDVRRRAGENPFLIEVRNDSGYTALFLSVRRKNIAMVKCLIMNAANVNCICAGTDGNTCTPLMAAAEGGAGSYLILQELAEAHGIDLDIQDNHGCTALMYAVRFGHAGAVSCLLEKGANPMIRNLHDESATDLTTRPAIITLLADAVGRYGR